jgi:predicted outer membrane protein
MKTHIPVALCALALLLPVVSSQAKPMMGGTFSQSDKKFLTDDAQGSIYDFSLAELAAGRASSSALHSYGLQLIADHRRSCAPQPTLAFAWPRQRRGASGADFR